MNEKKRQISLMGPALLIGLGMIFLLNNLGWMKWSAWETVLRIWPVLLIAWGLDLLIGRRSLCGAIISLVLILAVIAGSVWWLGSQSQAKDPLPAESIRQPLGDAAAARVTFDLGVDKIYIEAGTETEYLMEAQVALHHNQSLTKDYSIVDGKAELSLSSSGVWRALPFSPIVGERTWDVGLNKRIPLQIDIDMGVGALELDLSRLKVTDLTIDLGIGMTKLTLPSEGRVQAEIDSAIGQTVIIIPESMAARINIDTGIASREIPRKYAQLGEVYISPAYMDASEKIDIKISQAIGQVVIRHPGEN
jgi:hypothetical protein